MWIIAGVLLGLMVLVALAGFHTGPHTHAAAGVLGALAALWLVAMAVDGRTSSILWALLTADLVLTGAVGVMAWNGLSAKHVADRLRPLPRLEGAEGVAISALSPEGIVRACGEEWTAVSINGPVPAGGRVQVVRRSGVRVEVWGEDPEEIRPETPFVFDSGDAGDPGLGKEG
jgi:membrane-bound ClpP family serine protease